MKAFSVLTSRRAVALFVPLVLLATSLATVPTVVRPSEARAVEPPPGGIVESASNVDRLEGKFSVSDDGVAQYDLPLWVPQGRGAVPPRLSLSYSSSAGNGLVGVGWSLRGLSSITPCPRTVAQDGFTDGVQFNGADPLCLGGNRLMPLGPVTGTEQEYRTEQESFARIVATGMGDGQPDAFKVFAKDGTISTFGETDDSELRAFRLVAGAERHTLVRESATSQHTLSWSLNKVEDRNGNAMTVEYEEVAGGEADLWHVESRPKVIRYAPNREVRFSYESRVDHDPIESYARGFHSREPMRLSKIEMFGAADGLVPELLRQYLLEYRNDSITRRSLLSKISSCDKNSKCLVPLLFDWSMGSYDFDVIDTEVTDAGQEPSSRRDNRLIVGDIDGDGKDDITYPVTDEPLRVGEQQVWKVRRSIGSGFTATFSDAEDAGFVPPVHCPGGQTPCISGRAEIRPIDADIDGRMDMMVWVPVPGGNRWRLHRSNGSSFVPQLSVLDSAVDTGLEPDPVYFGDFDGNGTPDYASAHFDKSEPDSFPFEVDSPWFYRLNTLRPTVGQFTPPVDTGLRVPRFANGNRPWDVNGDNRIDIGGTNGWGLNTSNGAEERQMHLGIDCPLGGQCSLSHRLGDVNGDGLADSIDSAVDDCGATIEPPGRLRASLNPGFSGSTPLSTSPSDYFQPRKRCIQTDEEPGPNPSFDPDPAFDNGLRVVDFNGDGQDDVLIFRGGEPDGSSRLGLQLYTWRAGAFERVADLNRYAGNHHEFSGFRPSQVLDFDGDGTMDIVHVEGDHLRVLRRRGGTPDLLTGAGNFGPRDRVEIRYSNFADRLGYTPLASTFPSVSALSGGTVVASHSIVNFINPGGTDGLDRYIHTYEGGRMDVQGRGWLGFSKHVVSRLLTGESWTTEFDNTTRDTNGPSVYSFAGLPMKVTHEVPSSNGFPFYRRETVYDRTLVRQPGGGYTIEVDAVHETEQERILGEFQTLRENTTTTTYDDFGNADLVVSATTGGRKLTTDRTFRNDTARWLIGLPERELVTGCTPANECRTRESATEYDPETGNPLVRVVEPNSPDLKLTLTTTTEYGEFGTVKAVVANDHWPDGMPKQVRRTSFEYDADFLHPTATVNALGHRTVFVTDSGLGVTSRMTDPNDIPTTMQYDRFGRLVATHRADGSSELIIRSHQAATKGQAISTLVSGGGSTTVLENRLGQEVERKVKAFNGQFASTHTVYDELGRVHKVSRPAFEGETPQFTTTNYDQRNRIASVVAADNEDVSYFYSGRQVTTRDARNFDIVTVTSVDGDEVSRSEVDPASDEPLLTRFEYTPFGETAKIIAPDLTEQVMVYDARGQRTSLQDSSSGSTATTYTAFGEVDTETNAEEEVTDYDYDVLGRVVRTTTKDGVAINNYDTAGNGVGKITNARSADGVGIDYRYNAQGKPSSTQWSIGGNLFKVDYAYDTVGRQSTMTYPAVLGTTTRLKVAHVYNQHGYLSQVKDSTGLTGARITAPCSDADRTEGRCLWTGNTRDAAGQLTRETYGNGVVTDNVFKPQTGLLDQSTATGPGTIGKLADLDYEYDPNRNVAQRNDLVNNRHERYGYDELNRLTSWNILAPTQPVLTSTYTYDKMGNLTSEAFGNAPERNVTYGYGENGEPPHALTSRNTTAFSYDLAGRQTGGDRRSITYTAANLPKTITWGQQNEKTTTFAYDPNGARISKVDNEQTSITIPGMLERHNPAGTGSTQVHNIHHVTVDGRVVAQINKIQDIAQPTGPVILSQTTYLHQDLQGSTHLVTNSAGREVGNEGGFVQDLYYDPWGQRLDATNVPLGRQRRAHRLGYTSQFHDDELGLIDMKGRVYSPVDRRFTTPDPVIQIPASSQSHNRYAYVQNNPATVTDPTGLLPAELYYRSNIDMQMDAAWSRSTDLLALTANLNNAASSELDKLRKRSPLAAGLSALAALGGGETGESLRTGGGKADETTARSIYTTSAYFASSAEGGAKGPLTGRTLDSLVQEFRDLIKAARNDGYNVAADHLEHFLDGKGATRTVPVGWLRSFFQFLVAERRNQARFETQLKAAAKGLADGASVTLKDYWDAKVDASPFSELFYASGQSQLTSTGTFTLTRTGNTVVIAGTVQQRWADEYNWNPGMGAYIPGHGIVSDDVGLDLKYTGRGQDYNLEATYTQRVIGTYVIEPSWWKDDSSHFTWGGP